MIRWTPLPVHCSVTGDTPADVRERLASGQWTEGTHTRSLADGTIEVSPTAYDAWVESCSGATLKAMPARHRAPGPGSAALGEMAAILQHAPAQKASSSKARQLPGRARLTPTNLYRHFGKEETLLYVGVSLSAVHRLAQHMRTANWERLIEHITVERFPSRAAALEAEIKAIRTEAPLFNVKHATECSRANRRAKPVRIERQSAPVLPQQSPAVAGIGG